MKIKLEIDGKKIELFEELMQTIEEAVEKKPVETLKPKNTKKFWMLDEEGNITWGRYSDRAHDRLCYLSGNSFKTQESAEKEDEKRKAIMRVREYIANEFGVFEHDNIGSVHARWLINYYINNKSFEAEGLYHYKPYSPISYFKTEEDAQKVIDNCEDDLKIIWDV